MIWVVHGIAITGICWAVGVAVLIHALGDRWWLGTLALFGPRWLIGLPVLAGVVTWPWLAKYVRWSVVISVLVTGWFVLGVRIPWSGWFARPQAVYRVLTCNVAGWAGGTERLEQLIVDSHADIVMLQEYTGKVEFLFPAQWSQCSDGRLLIASRYPLENKRVVKSTGRWPSAIGLFCDARTPDRTISLGTLHFASPQYGLSQLTDSKTILAPSRRDLLERQSTQRGLQSARVAKAANEAVGGCVIGGDFNMPVESVFFREHWHGYANAFSTAGLGIGNTRFVEKAEVRWGARIDHLLTRGAWHALRCWTGPDVSSDHRPVLADIYWD